MKRHAYELVGILVATAASVLCVSATNFVGGEVVPASLQVAAATQPKVAEPPAAKRAVSQWKDYPIVEFDGTLLDFSPRPTFDCGYVFVHQIALYRLDEVVAGTYSGSTIVVDHPSCGEDLFRGLRRGDRVRLKVSVRHQYSDVTCHPGIRDMDGLPDTFYVAEGPIVVR